MFTPLITFMDAGWFIVILVAVYGLIGLIKGISEKTYGVRFVFSVLSVVFGIAVIFFPRLMLLADGVLIYMVAVWFVMQGFVSVFTAVNVTKRLDSGLWILQLIFGILGILLGCYSFFHPALLAVSIGFLIGFYFVETGFTMLFSSSVKK
jgi:uncharacterized membrane protein HdeD (DUF308 family)